MKFTLLLSHHSVGYNQVAYGNSQH